MKSTPTQVICCGEALIDMLPSIDGQGQNCYRPVAGGALFNTAIALGRLGSATGLVCGLSTDLFAQLLEQTLSASKVDYSQCPRSAQPTTLAFVDLINGQAKYSFFDENSAGRGLRVEALPQIGDSVRAMHFGAISLAAEPCGSAFEHLLLREAKQRVISLDPNIRPSFISDIARYRARIERLIGASDILKISDEDLAWLEPSIDSKNKLHKWFDRRFEQGLKLVAYTQGAHSTLLATPAALIEIAPSPRQVIDTVGAGDTFNAGLLHALNQQGRLSKSALSLLEHDALKDILEFAHQVAGIVVERQGANPPWANELR